MFFMHWTPGRVTGYGVSFDLILNFWPGNTTPVGRCMVSLTYRPVDGELSFMVIDSENRDIAGSRL